MASLLVLLVYFAFYLWPAFLAVGAVLLYLAYRRRHQASLSGKQQLILVAYAVPGVIIFALGLYGMH